MTTLIFDTESDNLVHKVTKLHCIAIVDADTRELSSYADQPGYCPLAEGLSRLEGADILVGHNIIKHDIPTLQKLYSTWKRPGKLFDTLFAARLTFPDIWPIDQALMAQGRLSAANQGNHGLEAWGDRLGCPKGSYGAGKTIEEAWGEWNPEMHSYMEQDSLVNLKLYEYLLTRDIPHKALALEQATATLCALIERNGIPFDRAKAEPLALRLMEERLSAEELLAEAVGTVWVKKQPFLFTPKRDDAKKGYVAGWELCKVAPARFNPGSRSQMVKVLQARYGWKPTEFTAAGNPVLDDEAIEACPLPGEIKAALQNYLMLDKRLGALSEGNQSWLKLETNGVIHAEYNSVGAITWRSTHKNPNISQTVAVDKPWGKECRDCFSVPPALDWKMVDTDLDGLELRMLANELFPFDGGAYAEAVISGNKDLGTDAHSVNCRAFGLDPKKIYTIKGSPASGRDASKTIIYAMIYGSGDYELGLRLPEMSELDMRSLLRNEATLAKRITKSLRRQLSREPLYYEVATGVRGSLLKRNLFSNIPALKKVQDHLGKYAKDHGHITTLDDRIIPVRSPHSVLNFRLQGGGALVCKKWIVNTEIELRKEGLKHSWDGDYVWNVWSHDEELFCSRPGLEDTIINASARAAVQAGEHFGLYVPIKANGKVGRTWAEVH